MTLNELRDKVFAYAGRRGFHEQPPNFREQIAFAMAELAEALKADRSGKWGKWLDEQISFERDLFRMGTLDYEYFVLGTVEEKIANTVICLCNIAGIYKIDLESHVNAKMTYNEMRPPIGVRKNL